MKNINLFLFLLNSIVAFSQDILMQNATVNRCSGVFYDSGGSSGNYSSTQSFVLTICPENAGQLVQLNFTSFSTQINADLMTIYDGDSTAANAFGTFSGGSAGNPGFVSATQDNNPSGCLTIEFVSDGANTGSGWAATISCLTTCQTINSQLDSATPAPNGNGYIRVCPDDLITLNGSGTFSASGTGATYEWDLGDGNTASSQSATFSYPNPGVYIVNLNITDTNPQGCTNTNLINQVIQVGTEPDFTGTQATQTTLCYGESTTITGNVAPIEFINDCTPPVSGTTYLPDGSGAVYSTCITVDCFESNQTLTDPSQLTNICLNMEHSYLGDLQMVIISPNGQQAILKAFPGGLGTYLGGAYGGDTNTPGVGADYCFSMTGTQLLVNGPTVVAGTNPPNASIVPGIYLPAQSFSNLVGSPLNGNWCIRVVDNLAVDNGYIFSWGLDFDANIQPPELSFTPVITSEAWDTDITITNTTGNTITVSPTEAGQYCYTYRVMDDFGCEHTEEVCIDVLPEIILATPNNLFLCNSGTSPFIFDLTQNTPIILAPSPTRSDFVVTYHESQADAENDTAAIANPTSYTGNDAQIIYVRIEYLTSGCYEIETFSLNITSPPTINPVNDLIVCDDISNDGVAQFDLDIQTLGILGAQPASDFTVTYYTSFVNADTSTGSLTSPYTNISNPQPIYIRIERVGDGCYTTGVFGLRVDLPPVTFQPTELSLCEDAVADEMASFDLTVKDGEITGGDGSLSVSYFTTAAGAQSGMNPISPATAYTNMGVGGSPANPQTLYVRVTDTGTGCTAFRTLTIRVLPNPAPAADPSDIVLCDDINTGDGQEVFDLTENEAYILGGVSGMIATYHESYGDAESNTGAISNPASYTNVSTNNTLQTIYVRVTNDITGCFAIVDFGILVNPLAEVVAVTDYVICDDNDDGFSQFDLDGKDGEVLNGQDPSLYDVTYHATLANAENLTGSLNIPYTNTSNPQQIFVAITNNQTSCSISTVSFLLEVDNGARANMDQEPIEQVQCDYLGDNEGIAQFDLTENNEEVLDSQDAANYVVTYYATLEDADLGNNAIPNIYENLSNPQTIYVRVDNNTPDIAGMDSSICYDVEELTLRVDLRPIIELEDSYTLCLNTNGTEVINPPLLDTGLSAIDYTFEWTLDGTLLAGETAPILAAGESGTYVVNVTNNTTDCVETDSAMVVDSSPPMITVEIATQAFSENSIIVAMATGEGVYEYSLDNGAWQESSTFTDVSFGEHTVTARDINGCGVASGSVTVMDYPQFFTPNGDGRNETWNIVGFAGQSDAKIYIFDRYGKLLKQISPAGQGWNGTYNGELMPTSDYWFTVEYNEPSTGAQKKFGAHFTLKR